MRIVEEEEEEGDEEEGNVSRSARYLILALRRKIRRRKRVEDQNCW